MATKESKALVATNGTGESNPLMILQQAVAAGNLSVEVMERLMGLAERYEKNVARKAYDHAMAAIREDLPTIIKDREVDYTSSKGRTNYKFEDLASVTKAVSPVMAKHGLSFRWRTSSDNGIVSVTCIISHADGHSEETTLHAKPDDSGSKNAIQAIGSAVTYLQRYTLKAALGIAAENDDDGQAAGQPREEKKPEQKQQPAQEPARFKLSPAHLELKKLIDDYVRDNELTPDHFSKVLIRVTTFRQKKDGQMFHGKGDLNQIDEKVAAYGIKQFKATQAAAAKAAS